MKYIFLLLIALICIACADQKSPLLTIEGRWYAYHPAHPAWVYDFDNGILVQSITDLGGVITTQMYTYAERGDTLYIGGNQANTQRTWLLEFHSPDKVEITPINVAIGQILVLKR